MKVYKAFWTSSLHGNWTPVGVHALYTMDDHIFSEAFRNNGKHHAEDGVMKSLTALLPVFSGQSLSVTVYQSLSPCQRCCHRYRLLLDSARQRNVALELTLVFPGFYKILRPSCAGKACRHPFSPEEHGQQLAGLQGLRNQGLHLRCFRFQDWWLLGRQLGEAELSREKYEASQRAEEDRNMERDLHHLGLEAADPTEPGLSALLRQLSSLRTGRRGL